MKSTFNPLILSLTLIFFTYYFQAQGPPTAIANSLQNITNNSLPSQMSNSGVVLGIYVPGEWSWHGASGHAISGATITGDGVSDMIKERLENYLPYFKNITNE